MWAVGQFERPVLCYEVPEGRSVYTRAEGDVRLWYTRSRLHTTLSDPGRTILSAKAADSILPTCRLHRHLPS